MNVVDLILELGRWGQTHRTEMLTGLVGLPLLLGGATSRPAGHASRPPRRMGRPGGPPPAKYAGPGSMAAHGVVLGRLGGRLLGDASETHVLLVAPTRSGKGVGVIIPDAPVLAGECASFWTPRTGRTTT